jgi:hypothetical protein
MRYVMAKNHKEHWLPSRLFIYYCTRAIEGTIDTDAGASSGSVMEAISRSGACDERTWPYIIEKFAVCPTPHVFDLAKPHRYGFSYKPVNFLNIKQVLTLNVPIIFGISLFYSFYFSGANGGEVPDPGTKDGVHYQENGVDKIFKDVGIGGHCMLIVGYDDKKSHYIVQNSWGDTWGDKGFVYISYKNMQEHAWDMWGVFDFK